MCAQVFCYKQKREQALHMASDGSRTFLFAHVLGGVGNARRVSPASCAWLPRGPETASTICRGTHGRQGTRASSVLFCSALPRATGAGLSALFFGPGCLGERDHFKLHVAVLPDVVVCAALASASTGLLTIGTVDGVRRACRSAHGCLLQDPILRHSRSAEATGKPHREQWPARHIAMQGPACHRRRRPIDGPSATARGPDVPVSDAAILSGRRKTKRHSQPVPVVSFSGHRRGISLA